MTDRYDEMRVAPDHSQAEELRQRLHARMAIGSRDDHHGRARLHLDTDHVDADELEPLKEITVSPNTPTSDSSNRRRLLMAAAAVVVVIGVAGIALVNSSDDDDETPSPAATTVAPTTTGASTTTIASSTQTVSLSVTSANIPVTLTAPADWTVGGNDAYKPNVAAGLRFDEIDNIYADGCQWVQLDPPVGPTVDDLVAAWANVPDFAATAAVDVTVDGYAGKQIEFTVPDYTNDECTGISPTNPLFALFYSTGDAAPGFWAQGPSQHTQQRILDVDGTRLVITALYLPRATPQDRAALDEALASIQIG